MKSNECEAKCYMGYVISISDDKENINASPCELCERSRLLPLNLEFYHGLFDSMLIGKWVVGGVDSKDGGEG